MEKAVLWRKEGGQCLFLRCFFPLDLFGYDHSFCCPDWFSEELSRVLLAWWLKTATERLLGPAVGRERPLVPRDQVLPMPMETPHSQGITMETLCSVHPRVLFQSSLAVSGARLQWGRFWDSRRSYSPSGDTMCSLEVHKVPRLLGSCGLVSCP